MKVEVIVYAKGTFSRKKPVLFKRAFYHSMLSTLRDLSLYIRNFAYMRVEFYRPSDSSHVKTLYFRYGKPCKN